MNYFVSFIKISNKIFHLLSIQANTRFNGALAENAKLRDSIDHMRSERVTFEGIYKKLEKELGDLKREMGEVIETSTAAYDAR